MKIRLAKTTLDTDSVVDGEGIRSVLWTQGCSHNCLGCHNPNTHSFKEGSLVEIEDIFKQIDELEDQDGLTLSGGDPMYQIEPCLEIAKYCHTKGLNIWCYTGFTYEELLNMSKNNSKLLEFLKNIDILVDGPFMIDKKSMDTVFRGSTNQRIIDLQKSLPKKKPVLKEEIKIKKKKEYMYV